MTSISAANSLFTESASAIKGPMTLKFSDKCQFSALVILHVFGLLEYAIHIKLVFICRESKRDEIACLKLSAFIGKIVPCFTFQYLNNDA